MERRHLKMVEKLLKGQSTLTLSTTGAEGAPRSAPLFYLADDGLRLYWLSSASSGHSRDLERDPRAAVAVYRPTDEWRKIRGVQMRGTVCRVSDRARRDEIVETYRHRFRLGRPVASAVLRSAVYCFQPGWVRFLDNSCGFGYRFEFRVKLF